MGTKVSVVIPCYYSHLMIEKVVELTRIELLKGGYEYEFVLVNDGSTDGTFDVIRSLAADDPHVIGLNLARNFGQHSALIAGLAHVSGDLVVLMDDDMQTHPSQIHRLLDEMRNDWDVVFAQFPDHKEAWWRRMGSNFANWTMRMLTRQPKGIVASNYLVMKRFVADEIVKYDGPYVYIQGLIFRVTNSVVNIPIEHFEREEGTSGYTLKSLVRLWSTVIGFSLMPLRAATIVGGVLGIAGLVYGLVLVIRKLVDPEMTVGWGSLMAGIMVCSGIIVLFLGLIGEYVGRLFMAANKQPQYVLRESVGLSDERPSDGRPRDER